MPYSLEGDYTTLWDGTLYVQFHCVQLKQKALSDRIIHQIRKLEVERTKGVLYLYEEIKQRIWDYEQKTSDDEIIEIQDFKIRVGIKLMEISNFRMARGIYKQILQILEQKPLTEMGKVTYNQALLGFLKCEVYLKNPISSELIAKKKIDINYIKEKEYFRELSYESNKQYWAVKYRWISFPGLIIMFVCVVLEFTPLEIEWRIKMTLGLIGFSFFFLGKLYSLLNQDFICIDPLEIIVVKNKLKKWLNEKFDLTLGKQPELE